MTTILILKSGSYEQLEYLSGNYFHLSGRDLNVSALGDSICRAEYKSMNQLIMKVKLEPNHEKDEYKNMVILMYDQTKNQNCF